MAGLTSEGLNVKRLNDVIEDRISSARNHFGNDVGTSVNDVIGRLLRTTSTQEADLWELAEAVYNSFNPAFATGASLDRIVAYAGLTRYEAQPSVATLLVSGDYLTSIPSTAVVSSSATSYRFLTDASVFFDLMSVSSFICEPITVEALEYRISIGLDVFTYTPPAGATLVSIAGEFERQINLSQNYTATIQDGTEVVVSFNDVFVARDVSSTTNITFRKVSKTVRASSEEVGVIGQPSNTLDIIGTPVLGWDTVTNPVEAAIGHLRETDTDLRLRFRDTKELNARGTVDAIFSNLIGLRGVSDVQVYQNEAAVADINGIPAKSFSAVIEGGNSLEIAESIWNTKPAGISTFGNTSVGIKDSQGLPHSISFSRPVYVDIHMEIHISPEENGTIAADTDIKIVDALTNYFKETYSVGDDVVYSRLYTPINSVSGFQVDSLTIGPTATSLGVGNVVVAFDEIADIKQQNVNVIINP